MLKEPNNKYAKVEIYKSEDGVRDFFWKLTTNNIELIRCSVCDKDVLRFGEGYYCKKTAKIYCRDCDFEGSKTPDENRSRRDYCQYNKGHEHKRVMVTFIGDKE